MDRFGLRSLLRGLIAASLPLAALGCNADSLPGDADAGPPCTPLVVDMVARPQPDAFGSGGGGHAALVDGGFTTASLSQAECEVLCGFSFANCVAGAQACGQTAIDCFYQGTGRRPAGLASTAHAADCPQGAYWAGAAHLEAAAVYAFRALARELREHGAPRGLVARAIAAAGDEVRHARSTTALARRHGAAIARVEVVAPEPRTLAAIAEENAVEGCVRETWGALITAYQARAAGDKRVRRLMARIADDEVAHAELGWAVARWAEPRLSPTARRRARDARHAAFAAVVASTSVQQHAVLLDRCGLPSAPVARALAEGLRARLA